MHHWSGIIVVLCSLATVPIAHAADPPASQPAAGNPILRLNAADPHIALFGDRYYLYTTHAGADKDEFAVWSSPDLITWRNDGIILRFADLDWPEPIDNHAWAPAIIERNGKYYFYFSARSRIGVAVSDAPTGPFQDPLGKPLVPYRKDLSSIDPMAFIDDDGQAYLYWGAVPGPPQEEKTDHLFARKLALDMITFAGPEHATVEMVGNQHIEGSFVIKRNDLYYMMWSTGYWNAAEGPNAYRLEYGTADSPLGPFTRADNNPIMATDPARDIIAPGHNSVLRYPGSDEWYNCYHILVSRHGRRVCIDRLHFTSEGTIRKIVPTREGVAPRPIHLAIKAVGGGPFPVSQDIVLTATSRWPADVITQIEFFADGKKLGETESLPDRFTWKAAPAGFHRVHARATRSSGETATSAAIGFDVR